MTGIERGHIQDRFERFHAENPHVLVRLEALTEEYLTHGNEKVSIRMLWEVLRWTQGIETTGDHFKLNDHFHSRYVRLMIERHPGWASAFSTRELVTA